jgi:hypothetical protein
MINGQQEIAFQHAFMRQTPDQPLCHMAVHVGDVPVDGASGGVCALLSRRAASAIDDLDTVDVLQAQGWLAALD